MKTIKAPLKQIGQMMFLQFQQIASDHTSGTFSLFVPGGRSVVPFFEQWAGNAKSVPLSFYSSLRIFMVDERRVPLNDDESNYKLFMDSVGTTLVSQGLLSADQIIPYVNNESDVNSSVQSYEQAIRKVKTQPDLVILGVGEDGHVGGLPPGHHVLLEKDKLYVSLEDSPKPPAKRVTCSLPLLQSAQRSWLLFLGEAKQKAYSRFVQDTQPPVPVQLLKENKDVSVFTNLSEE